MDAGLQLFGLPDYPAWASTHNTIDTAGRSGDNFLPADHGTPYGSADDRAVQQQLLCVAGYLRPELDATLKAQRSQALTAQLHQQALQIAALESLTNALNCHQTVPEHNCAPMPMTLTGDRPSNPWQRGPAVTRSLTTPYAGTHAMQSDRLQHLKELSYLLGSVHPEPSSPQYGHKFPAQAQQPAPHHCNGVSPQPLPQAKGTGVFLPMACDQPEPTVKPLSRSQSSASASSRDSAGSSSDLSRLDSNGYHSSETDCSYIPAYGCSFPSKLPAGDARRVVGSKIGAIAAHEPLSKRFTKMCGS